MRGNPSVAAERHGDEVVAAATHAWHLVGVREHVLSS